MALTSDSSWRDRLAEINDELRSNGGQQDSDNSDTRWLPLESNPELVTNFSRSLGLPEEWVWTDVLGLETELLELVPQPVAAIVLLFPCTTSIYAYRQQEASQIRSSQPQPLSDVFFLRQVPEFGNACGTVACIHALANSQHHFANGLSNAAPLRAFLVETAAATPEERGRTLVASAALRDTSDASARDAVAQTRCPGRDAHLDHHFAAFARAPGAAGGERLVELDGAKPGPVDHGPTSARTFLADAAAVIRRNFFARGEGVEGFAMMALVRAGR